MKPPGPLHRALARLVRGTVLVDRGFNFFDRLRSRVIVRLGTDRFFAAYNDVTYGAQDRYRPDRKAFKAELFDWERRIIKRTFPPPPARVLIGGVGGGREALAMAKMGYEVTAFDRSRELIDTLVAAIPDGAPIEALVGSYEDLPVLRHPQSQQAVDVSVRKPFEAALCGWSSFSHVPVEQRLRALGNMAGVTSGPLLISYLPRPAGKVEAATREAVFSVHIGFYRELSFEEMSALAARAGLEVVPLEDDQESAVIVVRRPAPSSGGR